MVESTHDAGEVALAASTPIGPTSLVPASTLEPATRSRVRTISTQIDDLQHDVQRVTDVSGREIFEVAGQAARAPSAVLAGVIGGTVGAAGGLALGTATGLFVLTGPFGLAVGAALGVLAFRGRHMLRLERSTQKAQVALGVVQTLIYALPTDAPATTRTKAYARLDEIADEYTRIALDSMDD
jgi:hypothetical protein